MNPKNIYRLINNELCKGCGTCAALCTNNALKIVLNEKKGNYTVQIKEKRCKDCGNCLKVCPINCKNLKEINIDVFGKLPQNSFIGNYINLFMAYSKDSNIRSISSSGGFITQFLIYALEEGIIDGALVTRMKKQYPLEPEPFIARTKEEIIEASQSKYCPVPANLLLKEILESKEEEKFAVVGLPCHIQAIRMAEKINPKLKDKIILHLGLFCASYGVNFLATEYLLKKLKIPKKNVESIDYRTSSFPPGTMSVKQKDGKINNLSHLEFWNLSFSQFTWFSSTTCMLCYDQTNELADISIGSGWFLLKNGITNQSLIIVRNKLSKNILLNSKLEKYIKIININPNLIEMKNSENYKKKNLKSNLAILNLYKKGIPEYDIEGFLEPNIKTYLESIKKIVTIYFSSRRFLWNFMLILQSIQLSLFRGISSLKNRLRVKIG